MDLSTASPDVATAFDDFSDRLLRIAPGAEAILDATSKNPDESVLQMATALFWLFGQTAEAQAHAEEALASVHHASLNSREMTWFRALQLWQQCHFEAAARSFEELTHKWPEDLVAAKAAEFLYYILGQQHSGTRFLNHMMRLETHHPRDPDFLAMKAFAHELCGGMAEARRNAETALEITPRTPWAHHALEHVLLWEGNADSAIALMESWVADWEASARPVHSHNAWHLALAHLDRLNPERAFATFDAHVWMQTPESVVEQLDSIAFLWRSEMAGFDVPESRWKELVPVIAGNSKVLFMPFATAHYSYALSRAGAAGEVEELLTLAARRAADDDAEATRVWAPTGLPVVRASAALGSNRAAEAADEFDLASPRLTEIGGSDAQDDLFRFAHIDSLRRCGRKTDANNLLASRLSNKTASPLEELLQAGRSTGRF